MGRRLTAVREVFPIRGVFRISRGARTESVVVTATVEQDGAIGRGECVPYPRYGESVESVIAQIDSVRDAVAAGLDREGLRAALPAGAARNAVDCALWDLEAKRAGKRVWQLAGLPEPGPVTTAYTISVDTPEKMEEAARAAAARPLLKIKLTGDGDLDRVMAVRRGAPKARFIVDANEAWTASHYASFARELVRHGVELIEQPLPAKDDSGLASVEHPVPVCADESCHDSSTIAGLPGRYEAINIKLDKTGGLTEALRLRAAARAAGLRIMVGCMIGTSLAMAPALLVAQGAEWIDLDGPLLLARDRDPGLVYVGSSVEPSAPALWG
ncbi:MAG: dipeptide epimerase [Alphaproteobacteria bacterium]|nr:dipeptide epimerase [Alphaproteobacteria bacterium]